MNWRNGDTLRFYSTWERDPLLYDPNTQEIIEDFEVPEGLNREGSHHYKRAGEVWFTDLHHDFFIWNSKHNTVQDYSTTITSLLKENAPSSLSGDFRFELELSDGSVLYSRFNTLMHITKKKVDSDLYREALLSDQQITSMRGLAEDKEGNIYASYYTAVASKKKGQDAFLPFRGTEEGEKEAARTYSLSIHKNKLIWDMSVFDLKEDKKSYFVKDIYGQHVNHCIENDTLWAYEWYANTFVKYNLTNGNYEIITDSLINNTPIVSDISLERETGLFWFATQYYGILIYAKNGDLVNSYDLAFLGLPKMKNNIFFIRHEGDSVWFGTELGLGLLDKKTKEVKLFNNPISNKDGIGVGRKIYSVLTDEEGNFYLGTDVGICYFDKKKLRFQNLIPKHPLANIEFNRNSRLRSSDGRFYFGSIDGLYSFRPDQLQFEDDLVVPKPYLSSFVIFNQNESVPRFLGESLNASDELRLRPTDTDVTIVLGAPSFENEVFYRYRIPNIKNEWSNYTSNNRLEFVSFPSGRHEVQIRTYLRPESENFEEFVVKIFKPLPWYKRLWVQFLLLFSICVLIYYSIRTRFLRELERKEATAKLRTKLSSDLHDDVGSLLSGVALQSEVMSYESKGEQREGLNEISALSREAMDRMRDIVWAIDSRKDKYENLIDRMRDFAEKGLGKKDIELSFKVLGIEGEAGIDPDRRQNYYLIFKEAITNVIKHSDADKVEVVFGKRGKGIVLSIHDNGETQLDEKSDGLGLSNIRMRAKRLGGVVAFTNQDGFKMELKVP
jgi:hypothetical protein